MNASYCATHLAVVLLLAALPSARAANTRPHSTQVNPNLCFEKNEGQWSGSVAFAARGPGYSVAISKAGAMVSLRGAAGSTANLGASLCFSLADGREASSIEGEDQLRGRVNYLVDGDSRNWKTNIPTFQSVLARSVKPGVDIRYTGNSEKLQYDLLLAPGVDPTRVAIDIQGATATVLEKAGDLLIEFPGGTLRQHRPQTYQIVDGNRRDVSSRYRILENNRVGFEVGQFDPALPLVIDPTLAYATFFGADADERLFGFAVTPSGETYLAGEIPSFPGSSESPLQPGFFVAKFSADGTSRMYITYIAERPDGLVVDLSGHAYVSGTTQAQDFPATSTLIDPNAIPGDLPPNPSRAFVSKLSQDGATFEFATLIGISDTFGGPLAVDEQGGVRLAVRARGPGFPLVSAPSSSLSTTEFGEFIARLNPAGDGLVFTTRDPTGAGITALAVDQQGNTYTAGSGQQSVDFSPNVLQPTYGGGTHDVLVSKLDPVGAPVYRTYLGGSHGEQARAITADSEGCAYVVGHTFSNDFPTTPGAHQVQPRVPRVLETDFGVRLEGFVTKIKADGSAAHFSTLLGGFNTGVRGVAVDSLSRVFVTGSTGIVALPGAPGDHAFPQTSSLRPVEDGNAFVTVFEPSGASLAFSTVFYGGGEFIELDARGHVYVAGITRSAHIGPIPGDVTTPGVFQPAFGGGARDLLLFKIFNPLVPHVAIRSINPNPAMLAATVTVTVDSDEPLTTPVLTMGDQPTDLVSSTGTVAVFQRTIQGNEGLPRPTLRFTGVDSVGRTSVLTDQSLVLDFQAPSFSSISVTPSPTTSDRTVVVTFQASEALQPQPTVSIGGQPATFDSSTDNSFSFSRYIDGSEGSGSVVIAVSGRDPAGNLTTDSSARLTLDFEPPALSEFQIEPTSGTTGTRVVLSFKASEPITGTPYVYVGDMFFDYLATEGDRLSFVRILDGSEPEGVSQARIDISDYAGNSHAVLGPTFHTDYTPPAATLSVAPSAAGTGTTVTVTVVADELLGPIPTVTIGSRPAVLSAQNNPTFIFTRRIDGTEPAGTVEVRADLTDRVGYSATITTTTVLDFQHPTVTLANLSPTFAKQGTTVTIEVDASESLADAVLTIGGQPALALSASGQRYRFARTFDGTEGDGAPAIRFTGHDLAGNVAHATFVGLTTDVSGPQLSVAVQPAAGKSGSIVTIDVTTFEDLPAAPSVSLGDIAVDLASQSGRQYHYTHTLGGMEPQGPNVVHVSARDAIGNTTRDDTRSFVVDFVAPTAGALSVTPEYAKVGSLVNVAFSVTEAVATTPTVAVGGRPAALTAHAGANYTFEHLVGLADGEGIKVITVDLEDAVGNTSRDASRSVTLDFTPPTATVAAAPDYLKRGATLVVSLLASEPLREDPAVLLESATLTRTSQAGQQYRFERAVTTADTPGSKPIHISLNDRAGNSTTDSTHSVTLDFEPPQFSNISVSPSPAATGTQLVIQFGLDEPTATPPTVLVGNRAAVLDSATDFTYRFLRTIDGSEGEGSVIVQLSAEDRAHNQAFDDTARVTTDFTTPRISDVSTTPSIAMTGTTVVVTFTSSEALRPAALVTIGGQPASFASAAGLTHRFVRQISGSEGEGTPLVTVIAADLAGNSTSASSTPLTLDFTSPQVADSTVSPVAGKSGTRVTLSLQASEPLSGTPRVHFFDRAFQLENLDQDRYTFSLLLTGTEPEGAHPTRIELVDVAGNLRTVAGPTLRTDFTTPTATAISVEPGIARAGTTVTVGISVDEPLDEAPVVTLGSAAATLRTSQGQSYVYEFTFLGTEAPGPHPLHVTLQDNVGNVRVVDRAGVIADFTPPAPLDAAVVPAAGRAGTQVIVSFGASEAGLTTPTVSLAGSPFVLLSSTAGRFSFSRVLDGSETEGVNPTRISLTDSAGNASVTTGPVVRTDFTSPTAAITLSPARGTVGTTVAIRVAVSEALAELPVVRLGGIPQTLATSSASLYEYSTSLSDQVAEGPLLAEVSIRDLVGNSRTVTRTEFEADFTAPRFDPVTVSRGPLGQTTQAASTAPGVFSVGAQVVVTFVVSEELRADPVVAGGAFTFLRHAGTEYAYSRELDGTEGSGVHFVTILGIDQAGNTGSVTSASYVADFVPPTVSGISVSPSPATLNQDVIVRFVSSEFLIDAPTVSVGGELATLVTSSAQTYTYARHLDGTETQGDAVVSIRVVDPAGNERTDTSARVTLNFAAPTGVIAPAPAIGAEGSPVTFSALRSTDISGITSVAWSIDGAPVSSSPVFSHVFADGPTTATIDLTLTNNVGLSSTTQLQFPVSNVSPTVSVRSISSPASGQTTVTWLTVEPGTLDAPRATVVARDLVTQLNTQLVAEMPDAQRFRWDTASSKESTFQLFVTVRDKDGAEASASSNPVVVNNLPLVITISGADPRFFNPTYGETTQLTYSLSEHARATVRLVRSSDRSVIGTVFTTTALQLEGAHGATWDGKDPTTGNTLPDGDYGYSVEAVDLLGDRVTASSLDTGVTIVLDSIAPATPSLDSIPTLTNIVMLNLSGIKEPGSGIRITRGATTLVDATPDDSGSWIATVALQEGPNTLMFLARDRAGNVSPTLTRTTTLDSTPPPAPVITSTVPNPTLLNALTITGTKEAGAALVVNDEPRTATPGTNWTEVINLSAGTNSFKFEAVDVAGNKSAPTLATTVRTPNVVAAPTVNVSLTSRFTTLVLGGGKQANTDVSIRNVDTGETYLVSLSSPTSWSQLVNLSREEQNAFEASSADAIGSQSPATAIVVLRDTQAPAIEFTAGLTNSVTTTTSFVIATTYSDRVKPPDLGGTHTLSGIDPASARLFIDGADVTAQCTVTATGLQSPRRTYAVGSHTLLGRVSDRAGNQSSVSSTLYVVPPDDGKAPTATIVRVDGSPFTPAFNAYSPEHFAQAQVTFKTDTPVTAQMLVASPGGRAVAVVSAPMSFPTTAQLIRWDGKDVNGLPVVNGTYTLFLTVKNAFNRTTDASPTAVEVIY